MRNVIDLNEEHWDMIARRMRRAVVDRVIATRHRDEFEKLTERFERGFSRTEEREIRDIPNELVLEIVKAIRHRHGPRDAELAPIAERLEVFAPASMERGER